MASDPWQLTGAGQVDIHCTGTLTAFTNCPDHKRWSTPHITTGEYPVHSRLIVFVAGRYVAACIKSELLIRPRPVCSKDQRVPLGNQVVDGTESMAIRRTTIHAAIRLAGCLLIRHDVHILSPAPDPLADGLFSGLLARITQKTIGIVHNCMAVTNILPV